MSIGTLQQILVETQTFSQFSQQPSFTLTDILEEPLDEELIEDDQIDQNQMDCFFDDEEKGEQGDQDEEVNKKIREQMEEQQNNINSVKDQQKQHNTGVITKRQLLINKSTIRVSKLQNSSSERASTFQEISRHERIKSTPMLPLQQINNISFVILKNVSQLFQDPKNTTLGIPTSISATGNRFLAVGTSMGNIAVFEVGVKGHRILGTVEQRKFGAVLAMEISKDNRYLIAGHESGLVAVWDLTYFSLFKQQLNNRCKITHIILCPPYSSSSLPNNSASSQHTFITCDTQSNTYIFTIQKYLLTSTLKCKKLLQRSGTVFYDIKYHVLLTGNGVVAVVGDGFVLVIEIRPEVKVIGKIIKPDGVKERSVAGLQMGRVNLQQKNKQFMEDNINHRNNNNNTKSSSEQSSTLSYDIMFISWGTCLYLYRFVPSKHLPQVQQLGYYQYDFIIQLINEQNDLIMTLKICIQLKQQRLNIFEDKVEKDGKKGEKAMRTFCEAGKVFVEQMLKEIKKSNVDRAKNVVRAEVEVKQIAQQLKEMYEYAIQYYISIECQQYLFNTIYMQIIKNLSSYQYWQLFIESLTPFIIHSKLTSIPNAIVFREILTFFSQHKSPIQQFSSFSLIDKMITNLQKQSLYYQDSITILEENKLYRSLGYICSMNGDFISVLNKLLVRMIEANKGVVQCRGEVLSDYPGVFGKIVDGSYVNQRKIDRKVYENVVVKQIGLWISYQDTMSYFLKCYHQINQNCLANVQGQCSNISKNNKFTLLLTVVYQLIQQTSKLSSKQTIHQFLSHLFESLQNIQKKLSLKQQKQQKSNRLMGIEQFDMRSHQCC